MLLFFDTSLITFTDNFRITILNILLFILIYVATRVGKIYAAKIVRTRFKVQQIKVGDREFTVLQLVKQIINIIGIILAIQSTTINNEFHGLTDILEFKLFSVDDFHISVYNILLIFILYFAARLVSTIIRLFIHRNLSQKGWIDEGKQYTIITFSQYLIYFIFTIIAIRSLGVNLTALLVSLSALLVGLGLALQRFFGDIIGGFIILFEGTIKVGDIIEVEKMTVKVIEINLRATKVRGRDGSFFVLPNSKITNETVNNLTHNSKSTRISITFYVSHQNDIAKVKHLLSESAMNHRMTDQRKHASVIFEDMNEHGIQLILQFYTSHVWDIQHIKSDIRYTAYENFRKENIMVPFEKDKIISLTKIDEEDNKIKE
jgi:small-conductance mechanosensitive channel